MLVKADFDYGIISEKKNIDILTDFFKTKLIKDPFRYAPFDFHNEEKSMYLELKSRKINKNQYPTTIISQLKIDSIIKENIATRKYYFVFKYLDALCYIEYDKEVFKDFKVDDTYLQRGYKEKVCYIPVNKLKEIKIKIELSSESEKEN